MTNMAVRSTHSCHASSVAPGKFSWLLVTSSLIALVTYPTNFENYYNHAKTVSGDPRAKERYAGGGWWAVPL